MESFWSSRSSLGVIEQHARARRLAPWGLFGAVISTVVTHVDPAVVLPAIVGARGSLNLFVALVGKSGGGKSATIAAAGDLLKFDEYELMRTDHRTLGSGEGIAAAYVERARTEDGLEVAQHTDGVLFEMSEVDTLSALGGRSGATLMPELRKLWAGERIGFQNRSREASLPLLPHSYRAALILGVQPERSGALLHDAGGGTPQRFVWLDTRDPAAPEIAPDIPERLRWSHPGLDELPAGPDGRVMRVCQLARDEITDARLAGLRGEESELDGHELLCRLKVAAVLALLEGRGGVEDEDWGLAGVVMEHSAATRGFCLESLDAARRRENAARAEARGEAQVITADTADRLSIDRAKARVLTQLGVTPIASGTVRSGLSSRLRPYFEEALGELVMEGVVVTVSDEYQGNPALYLWLRDDSTGHSATPALPGLKTA